jgi:hypothetical protein
MLPLHQRKKRGNGWYEDCLLLGRSEVDDGARVLKVTCCLR